MSRFDVVADAVTREISATWQLITLVMGEDWSALRAENLAPAIVGDELIFRLDGERHEVRILARFAVLNLTLVVERRDSEIAVFSRVPGGERMRVL